MSKASDLQSKFCQKRLKTSESPQKIGKNYWISRSANVTARFHSPNTPMKSKKNLTRFTYETAAFEGWRLCISRAGTTFTKYFPDKKFGGGRQSLAAAETALEEMKLVIDGSKRVAGKLAPVTIRKVERVLAAVKPVPA